MIEENKNLGGRPSIKDDLDIEMIKKMYLLGLTDKQVAEIIGVTEQTINNWKAKDQRFFESIKESKLEADKRVVESLYKRAIGYKYDEITYEKSKTGGLGIKLEEGDITEVKHTPTSKTKIVTKEVVADITACIFWLKNRQPESWRDKREVQTSGKIEHEIKVKEVDLDDRRQIINDRLTECMN